MVRTNSKTTRQAVRAFVVDYLRSVADDESMTDDELALEYYEHTVKSLSTEWYGCPRDKISHSLDCGGWECGTYARKLLVAEWLDETEQEMEQFSDEKSEELFKYLVTREIMAMAGRW